MPRSMLADWVSVEDAREIILRQVAPLGTVRLSAEEALGYVLAEEIRSPIDLPPWTNSAMDGYAVRAEDVRGASEAAPRVLRVIDDVPAGGFPARPLGPGEATRIMTGAPVPEGADSVVRVEHTEDGGGIGSAVRIQSDADAERNIRARGEELQTGALVLRPGAVLGAAALGVGASLGHSRFAVVRRPIVGILASGDELVEVDGFAKVLAGRKIVSSNSYALAAAVREIGMTPRLLGIAPDDPAALQHHLAAARGCDALITSAGISMGEHDLMRDALLELRTEVAFWRVRMKPGSPFAFGRIGGLGGIPWFGLPGNPVSTLVTWEVFARPALLRMAGHMALFPPTTPVRMRDEYRAAPGLTHFPRVQLHPEPDGLNGATLTGLQGSGMLTSMADADALLVIPPDRAGAAPGERFRAILLGGAPLGTEPGY